MTDYAKNLSMRGGVTSGMDRIQNMPRAAVRLTAAQSIGNGVLSNVNWSSADYVTDGIWTAGRPTDFVINTAGIYLTIINIAWDTTSAAGYRQIVWVKNGVTQMCQSVVQPAVLGATTNQTDSHIFSMNAGDWLTPQVAQTTGGGFSILGLPSPLNNSNWSICMISTLP